MTATLEEQKQALLNLFKSNQEVWSKNSTALLNNCRLEAAKSFECLGIPSQKNEDYKYSDLASVFDADYNFFPTNVVGHKVSNFSCTIPSLVTSAKVTCFNSKQVGIENSDNRFVVGSLERCSFTHAHLFERYYNKQASLVTSSGLAALNTLFAQDGVFIYVPKNVQIALPIAIHNLLFGNEVSFLNQRNLIILEEGASLSILQCDYGETEEVAMLFNNQTEIFVEKGAQLNLYCVQNTDASSRVLNQVHINQAQGSVVKNFVIGLRTGFTHNYIYTNLHGGFTETGLYGLVYACTQEHVNNVTSINHLVEACETHQLYKQILQDSAQVAFTGTIKVAQSAQKTNAVQRCCSLLLSEKAQVYAQPQLIINADDVKCSHGATVGQLDEQALFYLKSRGVDAVGAHQMLTNAFAYEVLEKIENEPLRSAMQTLVSKRIAGEVVDCHTCCRS